MIQMVSNQLAAWWWSKWEWNEVWLGKMVSRHSAPSISTVLGRQQWRVATFSFEASFHTRCCYRILQDCYCQSQELGQMMVGTSDKVAHDSSELPFIWDEDNSEDTTDLSSYTYSFESRQHKQSSSQWFQIGHLKVSKLDKLVQKVTTWNQCAFV